jgi:hypothetical protein
MPLDNISKRNNRIYEFLQDAGIILAVLVAAFQVYDWVSLLIKGTLNADVEVLHGPLSARPICEYPGLPS